MKSKEERLFIYGSLGPGGPNHHVMEKIGGSRTSGYVLGELQSKGWGADLGFPGIVLDGKKDKVTGHLFSSLNLADNWGVLDEFEGEGYERKKAQVYTENEIFEAWVYAVK